MQGKHQTERGWKRTRQKACQASALVSPSSVRVSEWAKDTIKSTRKDGLNSKAEGNCSAREAGVANKLTMLSEWMSDLVGQLVHAVEEQHENGGKFGVRSHFAFESELDDVV